MGPFLPPGQKSGREGQEGCRKGQEACLGELLKYLSVHPCCMIPVSTGYQKFLERYLGFHLTTDSVKVD